VAVEGGIGGGEIGTGVGEAAAGSDGVDVCCGLVTSSMAGTRGGGPAREAHRQRGWDAEEQTRGGGEEACACRRGGGDVPAVVDSRNEKEGECTTPGARVMRAMKGSNRISRAGRAVERRNVV
jgi:hypothetical protein